jgi:general secretion pathway protein D
VEGTGQLAGTRSTEAATPVPAGEGYQLSFIDTEIASVVASVIGDGLGLPYLVDPQVKGTMTLQAARPLSRDEVLPALEAALSVYGAALVNVNGVYQVVASRDAPRRVTGLAGASQPGAAGFSVRVVPIKYINVVDIEKALRPFAPEGGILRVDEGRNLLVLAGTSRELATMQDVIGTFDVNWLAGMSFALYPVEYVDAKTLAEELAIVFAEARSPIANVVRIVPLSRLNSLMVVTHEASYLREVEAWIKRLDLGTATPGRRIYVYDVQNGKADDLGASLSKILSIPVETSAVPESQARTSSMDGGSMGSSSRPSGSLGGSMSANRDFRETASVAPAPGVSPSDGEPGTLKIVPNVENNALLIYATPSEFAVIEAALKRLDVTPIQVLIEASLAEVSLTNDLRFGIQWSFESNKGPIVLSEAKTGTIGSSFPGFSFLYTGGADIRAVLNALESVTDVNVISSPKLLVLNNREAELQIGDQVPITVQSSVSTVGETAPIVNSIQLRDTGVILRITPRANKSGLVLLDIAQEVSDVVPTTSSNIDSPTIQQRRIASTVAVRNGETIALGGLIRDSTSRTKGGVPLLQRIPLVGTLFGSTSKNNRRTELIILITPRVLRSQAESDVLMDELREQFRGLRDTLPQWTASPSSSPSVPTPAPSPAPTP